MFHEGWCFEIEKFKYAVRQFFQRADIFLLVMSVICASYGLVLVSRATASMGSSKFIIVQAFSLFLGLIAFVVLTVLDADILGEQWKWLCVINVALLVALVIFGQDDGTGNKSWIRFAGIGIQPSEVIKVLYIVISAKQMTYLKEYKDINSFMSVVQMAGHFAIVFGMIVVVSSDLGSASILLGIFLIMFLRWARGCIGSRWAARPSRRSSRSYGAIFSSPISATVSLPHMIRPSTRTAGALHGRPRRAASHLQTGVCPALRRAIRPMCLPVSIPTSFSPRRASSSV